MIFYERTHGPLEGSMGPDPDVTEYRHVGVWFSLPFQAQFNDVVEMAEMCKKSMGAPLTTALHLFLIIDMYFAFFKWQD